MWRHPEARWRHPEARWRHPEARWRHLGCDVAAAGIELTASGMRAGGVWKHTRGIECEIRRHHKAVYAPGRGAPATPGAMRRHGKRMTEKARLSAGRRNRPAGARRDLQGTGSAPTGAGSG